MRVGLLGTGKIGKVIAETLCKYNGQDIELFISKRSESNSSDLSSKYDQIRVIEDNQDILEASDIIIIALRTTVVYEALQPLIFKSRHKIISVVPSTTLESLKRVVNEDVAICRMTPLPPAVYGLGTILTFQSFSEVDLLFGRSGMMMACESEEELHGLWAVSGLITPYYELLSQMALSAEEQGVRPELAKRYVASMCSALSEIALLEDKSLGALGEDAKTPGGLNALASDIIGGSGLIDIFDRAYKQIMERFPKK